MRASVFFLHLARWAVWLLLLLATVCLYLKFTAPFDPAWKFHGGNPYSDLGVCCLIVVGLLYLVHWTIRLNTRENSGLQSGDEHGDTTDNDPPPGLMP